jgi:hypothetical protein
MIDGEVTTDDRTRSALSSPAGKFFEVRPPNSGNHQYPKSAPLSKLGTLTTLIRVPVPSLRCEFPLQGLSNLIKGKRQLLAR